MCVYAYVCVRMRMCVYVCVCVCMYVCMCLLMYVYVSAYVCIFVCMYVCMLTKYLKIGKCAVMAWLTVNTYIGNILCIAIAHT